MKILPIFCRSGNRVSLCKWLVHGPCEEVSQGHWCSFYPVWWPWPPRQAGKEWNIWGYRMPWMGVAVLVGTHRRNIRVRFPSATMKRKVRARRVKFKICEYCSCTSEPRECCYSFKAVCFCSISSWLLLNWSSQGGKKARLSIYHKSDTMFNSITCVLSFTPNNSVKLILFSLFCKWEIFLMKVK